MEEKINTEFKRGLPTREVINVGIHALLEKELKANWMTGSSDFRVVYEQEKHTLNVKVMGDFILWDEGFLTAFKKKHHRVKVKFECASGRLTFLRKLTKKVLYNNINNYYKEMLSICDGEPIAEQEAYIYKNINRDYPQHRYPSFFRGLIEAYLATGQSFPSLQGSTRLNLSLVAIEDSKDYINGLRENPNHKDFKDLAQEVSRGRLSYAYYSQDKYSVNMGFYALALNMKR